MEENGTYGTSGVLFNGGNWHLPYFRCVVVLFVERYGGFLAREVV